MWKRSKSPGASRGFTLLEVLVALTIVAVALGAIIKSTGDAARNTAHLRDKTFAQWVALNQLAQLQVSREWPETGSRAGTEEMGNADWDWTRTVMESGQPGVRRVEVEVRPADSKGDPLVRVVGFVVQQPPGQAPAPGAGR